MNKRIKINILTYIILNLLVIKCLLLQILNNNWSNIFLCLLTLLLFFIVKSINKTLNIEMSIFLEVIVYLFIYSSIILGEVYNFFRLIYYWDTILHTITGFISAAFGYSLIYILNNNINKYIKPIFAFIVSISFSMLIGVFWEFIEFSVDYYLTKDMQKDQIITKISSVKLNPQLENKGILINDINKTIIYSNNKNIIVINGGYLDIGLVDTIKDLFVNFLGAIVFSILICLHIRNNNYKFIEQFMLKLNSKIKMN